MTPENFVHSKVRFIKLGKKGMWEKSCIEQDHTIRLGFISKQHKESLEGKWTIVEEFWQAKRDSKAEGTKDRNEIEAFYTMPPTTLWITFYKRQMYWCFADSKVEELPDGSRVRRVIGKWSCKTLADVDLHVSSIDGRVTKVQGFRRTICKVERDDYLIRKICGDVQPEVKAARTALDNLEQYATQLICGLWWNDFELLADLIFSRAGWQRMSVLGKTEKSIDIDMLAPVTNRRAFIQVKSTANHEEFQESLEAFRESRAIYDEMYFVVHTTNDDELLSRREQNVTILGSSQLAKLTINSGYMDWLIKKHE